ILFGGSNKINDNSPNEINNSFNEINNSFNKTNDNLQKDDNLENNKYDCIIGKPSKKFLNLKNKTFIHNSLCPITDRYVLKVWGWKYRKLSNREKEEGKSPVKIRSMLWEYYRDRKRQSVGEIMRKYI